MVALPGHFAALGIADIMGTDVIPMSQTVFSGFNLIFVLAWLIALPLLGKFLHPAPEDAFIVDPAVLLEPEVVEAKKTRKEKTPAERMETSLVFHVLICVMGWAYIVWHFATKGFDVSVNILIMILLFAGLSLTKNLISYVRTISQVTSAAAGILLTFPFYAGIQAMMSIKNGANRSLAMVFSEMFVSISTARSYPLWTLLSAGFLNMFIPSGGGQWYIQGPIMLRAGDAIGANPIKTLTATSYGDQITNLIQPFWMLPALSIAKLKARDIMGFLTVAFLVGLVIMALVLSFIGPF
jgi:short-chain fatty acids transporter